jgi:hypothetical protein
VADARRHLVERDQLELAIALEDTHGCLGAGGVAAVGRRRWERGSLV